jgi:hypothetical protein
MTTLSGLPMAGVVEVAGPSARAIRLDQGVRLKADRGQAVGGLMWARLRDSGPRCRRGGTEDFKSGGALG